VTLLQFPPPVLVQVITVARLGMAANASRTVVEKQRRVVLIVFGLGVCMQKVRVPFSGDRGEKHSQSSFVQTSMVFAFNYVFALNPAMVH
jgi:hypothetical protein